MRGTGDRICALKGSWCRLPDDLSNVPGTNLGPVRSTLGNVLFFLIVVLILIGFVFFALTCDRTASNLSVHTPCKNASLSSDGIRQKRFASAAARAHQHAKTSKDLHTASVHLPGSARRV